MKSLSIYFKSEPFLAENMAIIRNRSNPSFDKSAANNQTSIQELSQFLKDFEKKKNIVKLDEESEEELGYIENLAQKKNKEIMNKMADLMNKKSKNKVRWEQIQRMNEDRLAKQREKVLQEEERRVALQKIQAFNNNKSVV